MSNIIPFQFKDVTFRVATDGDNTPWFIAKEVAEILGYPQTQQALLLCKKADSAPNHELNKINNLPPIRKTGSYTAPGAAQPKNKDTATEALKLIPLTVRAARALGLDKNAAAISANQAVTKLTGTNVLNLLGVTHLEAENQQSVIKMLG